DISWFIGVVAVCVVPFVCYIVPIWYLHIAFCITQSIVSTWKICSAGPVSRCLPHPAWYSWWQKMRQRRRLSAGDLQTAMWTASMRWAMRERCEGSKHQVFENVTV
ncbi:unnamed protein product, partial [Ceratitis capitata]